MNTSVQMNISISQPNIVYRKNKGHMSGLKTLSQYQA